jgi:hypothetical protein
MEFLGFNSSPTPGDKSDVSKHSTNFLVAVVVRNIDDIYIPGFRKFHHIPDSNRCCPTVRRSAGRNTLSLTTKIK